MSQSKLKKQVSLAILSVILVAVCYKICQFIAVTYFFDKLYYQKSMEFGYWVKGKNQKYEDFGDRIKDLSLVSNRINGKILGVQDDEIYTIAILGDSYVWGLGLKNNQRFISKLKKELQKIAPVKILSLAESGDSTLEHLTKASIVSQKYKVDLFILAGVTNDTILSSDTGRYYDDFRTKNILDFCRLLFPNETLILDIEQTNLEIEEVKNKIYSEKFSSSWENNINRCVMSESLAALKRLSKNNILFFATDDYYPDYSQWSTYKSLVSHYNIPIVSAGEEGRALLNYEKCFRDYYSIKKCFTVSEKESHPSAKANEMYADILKNEIVNYPSFIEYVTKHKQR